MSAAGDKVAATAVRKLLKRAESAWITGNAERSCSLVFSEASFPEYLKLPQRADQDVVHARLRQLETAGAIAIDWDPLAGKQNQITRLRLIDANKLASAAGLTPLWRHYSAAETALAPWGDRYNVQLILARWRDGKTVRGYGPEDVSPFVQGCEVLDQCATLPDDDDVLVRRLSAGMFANSKRIEAIVPALDALTTEALDSPMRSPEEVLEPLGLLKMPQPVMVAGRGTLILSEGTEIPIPAPYIGISPRAVWAFRLDADCRYILTVENLTTFHELSMGKAGVVDGLIIYTAGMPSPSMLKTYRLALSVAGDLPVWHWGDVDLGGFRIAAALAHQACRRIGLWSMETQTVRDVTERKTLSVEEIREIERICARHGWEAIASGVALSGKAIEQESLPLSLP